MKKFYIGAAYYPELWDKSEVDKDIAIMKEYGMNCMRIGEFAWSSMERYEGEFTFDFFKYVVDKLYENGIYTVLCTPSCTPPRWVFQKYPDAIRVRSERLVKTRLEVHSRVHPCKSHKGLREKNVIIAREMAKAFANHPGVIGWQIDNEIYFNDYGCFCDNCVALFREYLKKKYVTIDNLNKKWGMYRWSLDYKSFDEINAPSPYTWEHPSRQIEWIQFYNDLICDYVHEQAEAIRKYSDAPIGTDMMIDNFLSYMEMNEGLDIVQHNHYNRVNELYKTTFNYDFYRTLKERPFWVTETQMGWNGSISACNGYRPIAHNYINSMLPIAHGAEMNLYWLYRSHPNGQEMGHGSVVSTSGRPNNVSKSIKLITSTLDKAEDFLAGSRVKSKIALTYSSNSQKVFRYAPIVEDFDKKIDDKFIELFYSPFRHHNIDVIETNKDLSEYDVIMSPFLANAELHGFKDRVIEWIKNGGTWIVGPLTDIMTEYGSKYTSSPYSFLEELCGVYTKYQLPMEDENITSAWADGEKIQMFMGNDAYELNGAESLATYCSDELDNLTSIARRRVGKGQVIILGGAVDKKALLRLVGKAPIAEASENIDLVERSGEENGIIAIEVENKNGYIVLDKEYYDIINERVVSGRVEIAPFEALFFKEIKK